MTLVSAGLHDAADDAEGQRSGKISGLLHSNHGHDVSPQSDPEPLRANQTFLWRSQQLEPVYTIIISH